MILKLIAVTSLFLALTARSADRDLVDGEEIFLIALHSQLLSELIHKPILQSEAVAQTVERTVSRGVALTTGNVTAKPLASQEAIALQLILQTKTDIATKNTTDGTKPPGSEGKSHPEIGARFRTGVLTSATTTKNILFRENGIAVHGASAEASSVLYGYGDLHVQAQGLLPGRRFGSDGGRTYRVSPSGNEALAIPGRAVLPRLRARMAPPQVTQGVMEQRRNIERGASETISSKLPKEFDETVWNTLLPFHFKYYKYVYQPFIDNGLLGGRLGTGSDASWLAMRGTRGPQLLGVQINGISGLDASPSAPILIRMHPELLERIAEMRFGGTLMTEVEAAELMGYQPPEEETAENVLGVPEQEVLFVFDEKKPIRLRFSDDRIHLTFRMKEATTLGKTLNNVEVSRAIVVERGTNDEVSLKMLQPSPASFYDGTPVPGELGKHLTFRFGRLLKKEPIAISKKVFFSEVKPMALKSLKTNDSRLTLGFAPVATGVLP